MSLTISAFHIDHGLTEMYPVDAAAATGNHPHEWSRVPWTDEMRAKARPHLEAREKRQAEEQKAANGTTFVAGQNVLGPQVALGPQVTPKPPAGGQTGDKGTDAEIVKRLQGETDGAKADVVRASAALDTAKGGNDAKATAKAQGDLDAANARLSEAQAKLDAAKSAP